MAFPTCLLFFCHFFKLPFFYFMLLYWICLELDFEVFYLLFIGLFRSHDLGCIFGMLTLEGSSHFFFNFVFSYLISGNISFVVFFVFVIVLFTSLYFLKNNWLMYCCHLLFYYLIKLYQLFWLSWVYALSCFFFYLFKTTFHHSNVFFYQ